MTTTAQQQYQNAYAAADGVLRAALAAATGQAQAQQALSDFYATMITNACKWGVDYSEFVVAQAAVLLDMIKFAPAPPLDVVATGIAIGGHSGPDIPIMFSSAADANQLVGAITVTTNTGGEYHGVITLGGSDKAKFTVDNQGNYPCNLKVGPSNVPAGSYAISLTATP
jgi:hypothetical protein